MCVPVPPECPDRRSRPIQVKARYALPATALVLIIAVVLLSRFSSSADSAAPVATPSPTSAARAVPTAPTTARLALVSQPTGATVSVDGVERGKTPTATPTPTPMGPVYPIAVMVENHVDARPQSGLSKADIVYEALVEGGISRFMAIYVDGKAEAIGPVRSARHYFVYIADEFNAAYVNIGWSPQAYNALQATGLANLDEIRGDPGFWRSRARYAPHNAYTSTELLRPNLKQQKPGSLASFQFRDVVQPPQGQEAREITIVYAPDYFVKYFYDEASKLYLRSMDGVPHKDADTGDRVSPRNVVVQFVRSWVIDEVGRLDMAQVGEGKTLYFRDGVVTEGTWRKASYNDITHWYDSQGKPMEFPTGKTWVQVVPPGNKVAY